MSTYNFSGDIGKVLLPALCAALLAVLDWHAVTSLMGLLGLTAALAIWFAVPRALPEAAAAADVPEAPAAAETAAHSLANPGFIALSAIGVIDSATRMGFLTLLPLLLQAIGIALNGTSSVLYGTMAELVPGARPAGRMRRGTIAARAIAATPERDPRRPCPRADRRVVPEYANRIAAGAIGGSFVPAAIHRPTG